MFVGLMGWHVNDVCSNISRRKLSIRRYKRTAYMVLFFGLPIRLYLPLEDLVKVQNRPLLIMSWQLDANKSDIGIGRSKQGENIVVVLQTSN